MTELIKQIIINMIASYLKMRLPVWQKKVDKYQEKINTTIAKYGKK